MTPQSALPKTRFAQAKAWVFAHKAISGLVIVALLSGVYGTAKGAATKASSTYVLATVSTGSVNETVSGSGQVSASNEVEVQSKAAGSITRVNVKVGDTVRAGQTLAAIDPGDAGLQLQQAQLAYSDTVTVKPTDLQKAQDQVTSSQNTLTSDYASAASSIASAGVSMTNALTTIHGLLDNSGYLSTGNSNNFAANQRSQTEDAYDAANVSLAALSSRVEGITPTSDAASIVAALNSSYTTAQLVVAAAKAAESGVGYLQAQRQDTDSSVATTAYTNASTALSNATSAASSLLSAQQAITSAKNALAEAQSSLADTQSGASASDVASAALNVQEKQQAYNDFFPAAPFAGTVAKVDVKVGDNVSSGGAIATVLTPNKIATISLNEVDAAKVKAGDKVNLTFDAIDGLSIIGTVDEIDLVGTVTSGVVTYNATISLDTDDPRIQSGMSVNADVITNSAQNVIVVPTSAIKTVNGQSYVQVVDTPPAGAVDSGTGVSLTTAPRLVAVTTGISDGTNTQITSGLTGGETIVERTVTSSSATRTTSTTGAAGATTKAPAGAVRAGGPGGARVFGI